MKKLILILSVFAISTSVFAGKPASVKISSVEGTKEVIRNIIERELRFPEQIEGEQENFALIELTVDDNGKLQLSEMNASSVFIREFVEERISEIALPDGAVKGTYRFRVKFHLIEG
jgi:hypothetical protein